MTLKVGMRVKVKHGGTYDVIQEIKENGLVVLKGCPMMCWNPDMIEPVYH
jgi:hypothetical protein